MEINHVRDKEKTQQKLSYKLFKEEDGYDLFMYISPFPTLIQFKEFIGEIQYCVTVVGR